jgi:dipeptidyl aminopeptidase/acylaminoacyl peptidase
VTKILKVRFMKSRTFFWAMHFCMGLLVVAPLIADSSQKQPLDHEVYSIWNRVFDQGISRDGQWVFWEISPEQADGSLWVRSTSMDPEYRFERGRYASFSHDSRYLVFLVQPKFGAVRQARLDSLPDEDKPRTALAVVTLENGDKQVIERVQSYALPAESGRWLAFLHGLESDAVDEEKDSVEDEQNNDQKQEREDGQKPGTTLVVRSFETGSSVELEHVAEYVWSDDGSVLAFTRISPDGDNDGLWLLDPRSGQTQELLTGKGQYNRPVFDKSGSQLVFLAQLSDPSTEEVHPDHLFTLYYWSEGDEHARVLADESAGFLAEDWHVSEHRQPEFSKSGRRVYFGTAPAPVEMPDLSDKLDDEVVKVDIWHWQDDWLQSKQLIRLEEERKRTWVAVAHLDDGDRMVQLARPDIPRVEIPESGDGDYLLGLSDLPYRRKISWDFPGYFDIWRIDARDGRAELLLETVQTEPQLSPQGQYIDWWDRDEQTWKALRLSDQHIVDLGQAIEPRLDDHSQDRPFAANPYATGHWLNDDSAFLIHDRHDIWKVDPRSPRAAQSLSQGLGLDRGWNLRLVDPDPDSAGLEAEGPWLATAFDERSKEHGFVRIGPAGEEPEVLLVSAHHYGQPRKAEAAEEMLLTRENFQEFPDFWVVDGGFQELRRLSDINPQQANYRWGEVSLVEWQSKTGKDHQGMLFVPENFDESRPYPMIIYFYERDSNRLHRHRPPQAHRSVIIPTFYTSNDYVVFVPDIWYREGYPGDSAMESIMPKARALAEEPWIDADRIGIQGHSWAGYQIAYMVTQTDFFRAAAGGAPVANMTSAYGQIRWQTGLSRMFQYERTQSRLGKTLWDDRELYIHNSPLFFADRINTPLLMMHNDKDGAVPWEQGIELFVALRRLNRPAWLVNYNNEPHWPTTFANRKDWQIRLQQYFDHYLMDKPAPRWLLEGIPALEKGSTLGYETD